MLFLLVICLVITCGIFQYLFLGDKNSKEEAKWGSLTGKGKAIGIIALIIFASLTLVAGKEYFGINSNSSSSWDSLSDEEQEWYEDNYGNGKSEAYDKAIEDYQNQK